MWGLIFFASGQIFWLIRQKFVKKLPVVGNAAVLLRINVAESWKDFVPYHGTSNSLI
jgi:hypothetical protein